MGLDRSRLKEISLEVIYSDGGFLAVDGAMVTLLKDKASASSRRRCRLCFHAGPDSPQQEMLIAMHRSSYVRPHCHHGKAETLTVIEGQCDAILFDAAGRVTDVVAMSAPEAGRRFFYRMPEGLFHTLIFRSEWLVYLETTMGPFDAAMTEPASWAPPAIDAAAGQAYLSSLVLPER